MPRRRSLELGLAEGEDLHLCAEQGECLGSMLAAVAARAAAGPRDDRDPGAGEVEHLAQRGSRGLEGAHPLDETGGVEPVRAQDLVVRAALGDAVDARACARRPPPGPPRRARRARRRPGRPRGSGCRGRRSARRRRRSASQAPSTPRSHGSATTPASTRRREQLGRAPRLRDHHRPGRDERRRRRPRGATVPRPGDELLAARRLEAERPGRR